MSCPAPCTHVAAEPAWTRWLPALLVPTALLPDLAAALPLRTYFFRDFTVTFLPLRLFAARQLQGGRLPFWNPYVFEGTFQLPSLYPLDLLHALWPSPVFVSWLLTLHLPLAALGAYWLGRELGLSRPAAFGSGCIFSLCGFTLSCLNLYVFLQALALTPPLAATLRRAALRGGRSRVAAAVVLAVALSTLAVEFVVQAVALGIALALAAAPDGTYSRALRRLAVVVPIGLGLAAVPIAIVAALLPETTRGAGFASDVALGNAVHPVTLLQTLLPHLFGLPSAPAEAWWGGRFFSKGTPYFLSLYLGPVPLALAVTGVRYSERRLRRWLLALAGLGLWYALGEPAGLAAAVQRLPAAASLRFPAKSLLVVIAVTALLAGIGIERLRRESGAWRWVVGTVLLLTAVGWGVFLALSRGGPALVRWSGVLPGYWHTVVDVVRADALLASAVALAVTGIAAAVRWTRLPAASASLLIVALAAADLARAGAGINPQVSPSVFAALPALQSLRLDELDGNRVFSYGLDYSPGFRAFLQRGHPQLGLLSFYLDRQLLAPYTNVLDRVEAAEASDLTSFSPRPRELGAEDYDPSRAGALVPWLRNAAVSRVLSLDVLKDSRLVPVAEASVAGPELSVHVYALYEPAPRAYLACRLVETADEAVALQAPLAPGFDPSQDVALAGGVTRPSCRAGSVRRLLSTTDAERYLTEADGAGYLVVRASAARGWRATVDAVDTPVLRANGKHRAVFVPAGRHLVELRYHPPGLANGIALTAVAVVAAVGLAVRKQAEDAC